MPIVIVFLLGIANFAMHKAVLESGHPLLAALPALMRSPGQSFGYGLEFLVLVGSMLLAASGSEQWAWAYCAYSSVNALSAWLILTRRV
ncbi:MAG: hypothetical protein ABIW31_02370 [Novosphingobium sp.]